MCHSLQPLDCAHPFGESDQTLAAGPVETQQGLGILLNPPVVACVLGSDASGYLQRLEGCLLQTCPELSACQFDVIATSAFGGDLRWGCPVVADVESEL